MSYFIYIFSGLPGEPGIEGEKIPIFTGILYIHIKNYFHIFVAIHKS